MLAFARFMVVAFVVLTVVYVALSLWSRSVRRRKLNDAWQADPQGDRDAFVQAGLKEYDHSLRRKLILGVYVVPMVVVGTILYLTNFT